MASAIHVEIDLLFLFILLIIAYQSANNVNQQMTRVLLRNTAYGIIVALTLDALWVLLDGRLFPGAISLNLLLNAVFLTSGSIIACEWYLYVLETLGHQITTALTGIVMIPALADALLTISSMWTGLVFTVNDQNIYIRGELFWLHTFLSVGMMMVSLLHILIRFATDRSANSRVVCRKLLRFYIVPVGGTLLTLPYTGMPGTWTCSAFSIILIYLDDQDNEIVRDSLTGLNNRKLLPAVFADYTRQVSKDVKLYVFLLDLNNFKKINDTFGHPTGDKALMQAADIFRHSVDGLHAMIARVGGDEFMILGLLPVGTADSLKQRLLDNFKTFNDVEMPPYQLDVSIGYCIYKDGQSLEEVMQEADEKLYSHKAKTRR